mmetsp:Transcript_6960/g.12675  ORF Transcript_6960/g.12675 Transcript_6960/m.12675 type:complete len:86 (-) Transcript_6960:2615-2872(-)
MLSSRKVKIFFELGVLFVFIPSLGDALPDNPDGLLLAIERGLFRASRAAEISISIFMLSSRLCTISATLFGLNRLDFKPSSIASS